jgi:hypothetical protein
MPEPVRCDICGKLYSSRHVTSHKRLAHGKDKLTLTDEQNEMKKIVELYNKLSPTNKESVRTKLATLAKEPS